MCSGKDTDGTITKNEELAETFDSFFRSLVDNLKIEYDIDGQPNVSAHPDPVIQAIESFKYHPSIPKITVVCVVKTTLFFYGLILL